ncbi:hypothetical protein RBH29_11135 [Herbivorax sp. ANBcel31]|uniref:hypothetical protein n=1 Tax=Herbivorax sp. ANBcel31 TaxID=3069754 RepID=UPI0027B45371|nr:hypothetical protein [Herbivorax sp. ANBcel31]MDQ2086981.1 hypothetical protein [Herbivorax sp. ANBcel31]
MAGNKVVLEAGNVNEVIRIVETVRRPLKSWSFTIHKLLKHLEENRFRRDPKFYGIDENDREILSFIPRETAVLFLELYCYEAE